MRQIAQGIDTFIQRTGGDFMQQRFPQMAVVAIDQRNFGFLATSQLLAELRSQLQPTGTAAYNHYLFQWRSQCDPLNY
ncbi:hypothetical protein D3C85_1793810 [compost metagenome]